MLGIIPIYQCLAVSLLSAYHIEHCWALDNVTHLIQFILKVVNLIHFIFKENLIFIVAILASKLHSTVANHAGSFSKPDNHRYHSCYPHMLAYEQLCNIFAKHKATPPGCCQYARNN